VPAFGLVFHEITTQSPASVWIALGKGQESCHPVAFAPGGSFTEPSLSEGVEEHTVEGVQCAFTQPQRPWQTASSSATRSAWTCNRALKDSLRQKKATSTTSTTMQICRVCNVIRPYMQAL